MENYSFLFSIALILLSTKVMGVASKKVNMPQVVGALLAGLILGPSILGLVQDTEFLDKTSEIGVIILMFIAGLDTDIGEIKKNSFSYILIATVGVLIPLIGGAATYYYYFDIGFSNYDKMLEAVFMGVILTATSVSITVEALREMGKLNGRVGSAILGAAVIDDIMGIVVLTVVTSLKDSSVSILMVLMKIAVYALIMAVLYVGMSGMEKLYTRLESERRNSVYAFAFVLIIAFISEEVFGVADITGAYLFGLFLSKMKIKTSIAKKMAIPSYLFFSPIFFASIGIRTELSGMTLNLFIFSIVILIVAILTKVIGCGIGARFCGYNKLEAINIGVGMISRGEVALIVAQKGYHLGLLVPSLFSPVVLMVVVTTIITPVILKRTMDREKKEVIA
ncbi:MAG TPA: cation:proton antiporter [Anaerovoracaceae bacterium]|nr:cation:proton antiporter [Anaerovoracaceae bacterium]